MATPAMRTGRTPDLSTIDLRHRGVPAPAGALARCVGDVERFVTDRWGRRAHLHQAADVANPLTLEDVDHIVTSMALRAPAFRLVKAGATLRPDTYTRRARIGSRTVTDLIDVGRVFDLFADGATIVLQGLHRFWPAVSDLCRELEEELTHPVQANAYITPPVAQGLRVHADAHDVFALQTHGVKQWLAYEDDGDVPSLDTRLQKGDCLYLPKGLRHAARTVDVPSIHLTLGVRTVTWADVLRRALDEAIDDIAFAESLPPGFAREPGALAEEAGERMALLVQRLGWADAGAAVDAVARGFRGRRIPALTGQLPQLLRIGDIHDGSTARVRPHATWEITHRNGVLQLGLEDRVVHMPVVAEPALRAILAAGTFTVADLADHLDEAGRVTLVRRLVREGLLLVDA